MAKDTRQNSGPLIPVVRRGFGVAGNTKSNKVIPAIIFFIIINMMNVMLLPAFPFFTEAASEIIAGSDTILQGRIEPWVVGFSAMPVFPEETILPRPATVGIFIDGSWSMLITEHGVDFPEFPKICSGLTEKIILFSRDQSRMERPKMRGVLGDFHVHPRCFAFRPMQFFICFRKMHGPGHADNSFFTDSIIRPCFLSRTWAAYSIGSSPCSYSATSWACVLIHFVYPSEGYYILIAQKIKGYKLTVGG